MKKKSNRYLKHYDGGNGENVDFKEKMDRHRKNASKY